MFCIAGWLVVAGLVALSIYQIHQNKLLKERIKEYSASAQAWSIAKVTAIPIEEVPFGEYNVTMVIEEFGSAYFLFRYRENWGKQALLVFGRIEEWDEKCSDEPVFNIVEQDGARQYSLEGVGIIDIIPQCRSL